MLERFKHRKVLITGAGSGLGKALAESFAKLGWSVWIADINKDAASSVAELIKPNANDVASSHCDITSPEHFEHLASEIKDKWGQLDIIINNAGVASSGFLQETPPDVWKRTMTPNLDGVYHGCYFLEPLLPIDGPAHIINVASFAGIASAPGMLAYNVSKASVIALSESLRIEMADRNIGVSVACPAFFQTNLVDSMKEANDKVKATVNKWMAASKIDANDVATDIIKGIEQNKFYIISHDYARKIYWFKRFFHGRFLNKMISNARKLKSKLQTH
ncbi:MAG: SDR family NAD(P)-dependent oxidoreductase [Gammaproteobacteria bacterium]|nr:SDR family NAD(P)-dependent oxidoreductase [Gammaproteobacteria bacterium]